MAIIAPASAKPLLGERSSINLIFLIAGLSFASWAGRLSVIDMVFDFSGSQLGAFLFFMTAGTLAGIALAPTLSRTFSAKNLLLVLPIFLAAILVSLGVSVTILQSSIAAFIIVFFNGLIFGCLDITMNVNGAKIERKLGKSIMPSLHGFFSLGSLLGAGIATATLSLEIETIWHFSFVAVVIIGLTFFAQTGFRTWNYNYSARRDKTQLKASGARSRRGLLLLLGLMVAGLSFAEGAANDWLAVASVVGHGLSHPSGALMFTLFTGAMTAGRFTGGPIVDRIGTKCSLMIMGLVGLVGIVLFILGDNIWMLGAGALLWGLGSSLGFPVGMSIAASRSDHLGPRAVSVISAFGYGAMLSGPPVIGFVADVIGLPQALWLIVTILVISLIITPRAAQTGQASQVHS